MINYNIFNMSYNLIDIEVREYMMNLIIYVVQKYRLEEDIYDVQR